MSSTINNLKYICQTNEVKNIHNTTELYQGVPIKGNARFAFGMGNQLIKLAEEGMV